MKFNSNPRKFQNSTWQQGERQENDGSSKSTTPNMLNPFSETAVEYWPDFESLLKSLIKVGKLPNANRPRFLQLHLIDQAPQFFKTLPQLTRDDVDAAVPALRVTCCSPNLQELRQLQPHKRKSHLENASPEDCLSKKHNETKQIYLDETILPKASTN